MFSFFTKPEANYDKLFYDFSIKNTEGEIVNFSKFKDKTVLLVNVASNCGFTRQYTGLQKLYEEYKDKGFIVIGVPSNQFGGQEPGTNTEIKEFARECYSVEFPMFAKSKVNGENTNPVFSYLRRHSSLHNDRNSKSK